MNIEKEISKLNPRQKEAVLQTEGPVLVLAGAGSGKTRVITTRVAYLIHKGVPPESVLAVTFTNKAAREMKERAISMLASSKGKSPVISTFHSLCLRILRKEIEVLGYRKNFSIYDTSEQVSLLRNLLADIEFYEKKFRPESILERISRTKNSLMLSAAPSTSEEEELESVSGHLSPKYHEALKSLNALDFDDLLLLTLKLFREHPEVLRKYRERFHYLMVDEYQDTNRVQYDFVRLLTGEEKNLCVVGDDDQSIYAWRGAEIGNILGFERDFPGTAVIRLEQNYRSHGHILTAANGVIRNNKKRMEKTLWTDRGEGPKVHILKTRDGDDEAAWVADRIAMLKYDNNLSNEDFAVIYRANMFSRPFEEALRKQRIPYTVVGGTSYFEHREVRDLAAYLKVIANPRDDLSLLRAISSPRRGLGPTTITKLADYAGKNSMGLLETFSGAREIEGVESRAADSASGFAGLIEEYRSRFRRAGQMGSALRELIEEIGYRDHLSNIYKTPEAAFRRLENVEGFIESISHYEKTEDSPSLQGFLEAMALTDILKEKDEKTRGGVTLISFHSAKGLEFPVVFIVGAEDDIIPHKKSMNGDGSLEEERRLFYVGITRAMNELYITYARHRLKYGKDVPSIPSRFISELPGEAVERIDRTVKIDPEQEERDAKRFFSNIKAMLGD